MQGNKILKKILGGCSLLLLTAPAFADMSLASGWYIEGNVGSTTFSGNSSGGSVSGNINGYNINFGYKFMPYVTAELGYTSYANSSIFYDGPALCKVGSVVFPCGGSGPSTVVNTGAKAAIIKTYAYDLVGKGIVPFYDSGFEAFAKVGVQRLATSTSFQNPYAAGALGLSKDGHSSTGLYLGGGVQYYYTPQFAFVGQWERASGSGATGTATLLSAGIQYIFG